MQPLLCIIPVILAASRCRRRVGLSARKSPHSIRQVHSSATRRNFESIASKLTTAPSGFATAIEGQNRRFSSSSPLAGKMVRQTSSAAGVVIDGHRRLDAGAPSSVQVIVLEAQNNTAIAEAGTHQIRVTRRIEVGTLGRKAAFVTAAITNATTAVIVAEAPVRSLQIWASSCSSTVEEHCCFQTARKSR